MLYPNADAWATHLRNGSCCLPCPGSKTYVSNMLREAGTWFHYSVDYRIGTRYMGEHIADNFKHEAMRVPLLRELLLWIGLYSVQHHLRKPCALVYLPRQARKPGAGRRSFKEYMRRQALHKRAEIKPCWTRATSSHDPRHSMTTGILCVIAVGQSAKLSIRMIPTIRCLMP